MSDHIVIIGSKQDSLQHLKRLVDELKVDPRTRGRDIILVSLSWATGLPPQLEKRGVRSVHGDGADPRLLGNAAISAADIVIILAWDEEDALSDSHTFDVLHRVRDRTKNAMIFAECVDDGNRARLQAGGSVPCQPDIHRGPRHLRP